MAGFDAQIAATRSLLQTATAALGFPAAAITGNELAVDVRVTNLTGHRFPTGFPSRRAWLHVTVRDASGQVVFESGAVDATGRIGTDAAHTAAACVAPVKAPGFDSSACFEPHRDIIDNPAQVAVYEAVLADTNAAITYVLLYADSYLKDNRLLPEGFTAAQAAVIEPQTLPAGTAGDADFNRAGGVEGSGSDTVHYRVALPAVNGPYTVDAELLFQSVRPGFVEGLSSNTTRVNAFRSLYRSRPPTVETLASVSRQVSVTSAPTPLPAGSTGSGGGCSLGVAGGFDPVWPGLLLAAAAGLARRRRG